MYHQLVHSLCDSKLWERRRRGRGRQERWVQLGSERRALLVDASPLGARLQLRHELKPGSRVTLDGSVCRVRWAARSGDLWECGLERLGAPASGCPGARRARRIPLSGQSAVLERGQQRSEVRVLDLSLDGALLRADGAVSVGVSGSLTWNGLRMPVRVVARRLSLQGDWLWHVRFCGRTLDQIRALAARLEALAA
ncbi:MAG: PilZ domain-containing protein [Candidatus Eremiobacterota bacterium]